MFLPPVDLLGRQKIASLTVTDDVMDSSPSTPYFSQPRSSFSRFRVEEEKVEREARVDPILNIKCSLNANRCGGWDNFNFNMQLVFLIHNVNFQICAVFSVIVLESCREREKEQVYLIALYFTLEKSNYCTHRERELYCKNNVKGTMRFFYSFLLTYRNYCTFHMQLYIPYFLCSPLSSSSFLMCRISLRWT